MRLPILPTLTVAVAVPAMVWAGFWQLGRRGRTDALAAALAHPVATAVPCDGSRRVVQAGGAGPQGEGGFAHLLHCGPITVDLGWTERVYDLPDPGAGPFRGLLYRLPGASPRLVVTRPAPPLLPSAPPGQDAYHVNHLGYAIQWFSFATILAVIYARFVWTRARSPGTDR